MLAKLFLTTSMALPFFHQELNWCSARSANVGNSLLLLEEHSNVEYQRPARYSANYDEYVKPSSQGISPNGDGKDDTLVIRYELTGMDNYASMRVVDSNGLPVKELIRNEAMSGAGEVVWNGRGNNSEILKPGYYSLVTEVWSEKGNLRRFRSRVVVTE